MRFVLAVHGTRGDVEPCATVGLQLQRRGHEVHMAVAPNMVDFWDVRDQPIRVAQVKRLKVGTVRRFSTSSRRTLVADLRTILEPGYERRGREIASRMTKPDVAIGMAADLLEKAAHPSGKTQSATTR
jgi:UDP:flavonoid glycosyltransferase YjiC (YdhE family)